MVVWLKPDQPDWLLIFQIKMQILNNYKLVDFIGKVTTYESSEIYT